MARNKLQQLKCLLCYSSSSSKPSIDENDDHVNHHRHQVIRQQQQREASQTKVDEEYEDAQQRDSLLLEQAVARGAAAAAAAAAAVEQQARSTRNKKQPPITKHRSPFMSMDNNHNNDRVDQQEQQQQQQHKYQDGMFSPSSQVSRMHKHRLSLSSVASASYSDAKFGNHNSKTEHNDVDDDNYTPKSRMVSPKFYHEEETENHHQQQQQRGRRVSKNFRNIHPAHAKIKARVDVFEGRRTSSDLDTISPIAVRWLKETNKSMDNHDENQGQGRYRRHSSTSQPPSSSTAIKDCRNDPYEYAYKIWYQMGLLAFRPKGMENE